MENYDKLIDLCVKLGIKHSIRDSRIAKLEFPRDWLVSWSEHRYPTLAESINGALRCILALTDAHSIPL